jgi:hypothetical protein
MKLSVNGRHEVSVLLEHVIHNRLAGDRLP